MKKNKLKYKIIFKIKKFNKNLVGYEAVERADGARFWGLQLTEVAEKSQVSQLITALMLPMRNAGWEFVK